MLNIITALKNESVSIAISNKKEPNKAIQMALEKDIVQINNCQSKISFSGKTLLQQDINEVLARFNKPVIPAEHLTKWLNQFDKADRPVALKLLKNIDFHTYPDLINETQILHKKLSTALTKDGFDTKEFSNVDFSKIYTCKSGDIISYIYRKSNKIPGINFKTIEALQKKKPQDLKNRALVLIDDYIGTGTQFLLEFYARNKENRGLINSYKKIYFVTITANDKAANKFDLLNKGKSDKVAAGIFDEFKNTDEVQDEVERKRIYQDLSTIKGDKLKLITLSREIPLLSPKNKKLSSEDKQQIEQFLLKYDVRKRYPFGVGNLQGHTCFFYSPPNALPEILWNSKIEQFGLKPLFKRTDDISIYPMAKYFKKDKHVW